MLCHCIVSVALVSVWLVQTLGAVDGQPENPNETVYIENGAVSAELSCGDVPDGAIAVQWSIDNSGQFETILKYSHKTAGASPSYRGGYSVNKYTVGSSVKTSLVVKNIGLSDTGSFKCIAFSAEHNFSVKLQVVVPPRDDRKPTFTRGDPSSYRDLAGPYVENRSESFTCYIRQVLPGKESSSIRFYYNTKKRLQSGQSEGEVTETQEIDGTKTVLWKFTTSFNRSDNGGKMRCNVNWKAGQYSRTGLKSELTENIDVRFGATSLRITEAPDSPVTEGTDAIFKCESDEGNPVPRISWSRGSGSSTDSEGRFKASKTESTLTLRVDKTMNQEKVRCTIEGNTVQTHLEEEVTLSVQFEATSITITQVPLEDVKEGDFAEYACETDSANPDNPGVLWTVDDSEVKTGGNHTINTEHIDGDHYGKKTRSTLKLKTNRSMNQKHVKCALENKESAFEEQRLSVEFPPNGLNMKIGEAVQENTEKSVECTANSANPVGHVGMEIYIDGTKLDLSPDISTKDGSNNGKKRTFEFKFKADRSQNGKPVNCRLLWYDKYENQKTEKPLIVTYPPDVAVEGTDTPAVERERRDLECGTTGGNPSDSGDFSYTWMYKPKYTESSGYEPRPDGSILLNGDKTLQLNNLDYDKMAGTYKCTVKSTGGQNSGNSTLEVYYPAKLTNAKEMVQYAALQESVDLTVRFRINPVTMYEAHWLMGDRHLQEAEVTNKQTNECEECVETEYTISDVKPEDIGNYTVQVINKEITKGNNSVTFSVCLEFRGPPETPKNVVVQAKSHHEIEVSWEAGQNGGFDQVFVVKYRTNGQDDFKSSPNISASISGPYSYTISDLEAEKDYEVSVLASNQLGTSNDTSQAPIVARTTAAPKHTNLTPIIAVVIVTIVLALIVGVGIFFFMRRKKKKGPQDGSEAIRRMNEYGGVAKTKRKEEYIPDVEYAKPNKKRTPKSGSQANGSKGKSPLGSKDPDTSGELEPLNPGAAAEEDGPLYAKPNKKKTPKSGAQGPSNKGKSPRKGKSPAPKRTPPQPPGEKQVYENVELGTPGREEAVYQNVNDSKATESSADAQPLVYADLTFNHVDPARQEALPEKDEINYATVDFDKTADYVEGKDAK